MKRGHLCPCKILKTQLILLLTIFKPNEHSFLKLVFWTLALIFSTYSDQKLNYSITVLGCSKTYTIQYNTIQTNHKSLLSIDMKYYTIYRFSKYI